MVELVFVDTSRPGDIEWRARTETVPRIGDLIQLYSLDNMWRITDVTYVVNVMADGWNQVTSVVVEGTRV